MLFFFPLSATGNCWWIIQWLGKEFWFLFFPLQHAWIWSKLKMTKVIIQCKGEASKQCLYDYSAFTQYSIGRGEEDDGKSSQKTRIFNFFGTYTENYKAWELNGTGKICTVSHGAAFCKSEIKHLGRKSSGSSTSGMCRYLPLEISTMLLLMSIFLQS